MKGFLNGGIFPEDYIRYFEDHPSIDSSNDISRIINMEKYCKEHIGDAPYLSIRELLKVQGMNKTPTSTNNNDIYHAQFRTSFRIIAKQNNIHKSGDIFVLDPDFNVEYTINAMPEYERYLNQYRSEHGCDPNDYTALNNVYLMMAQQIKTTMPKLPMCRDYFAMLGIINFMSYYYQTLKSVQKVPILPPMPLSHYSFPHILPPLPTRYPKSRTFSLSFSAITKDLTPQMKTDILNCIQHHLPDIRRFHPDPTRNIMGTWQGQDKSNKKEKKDSSLQSNKAKSDGRWKLLSLLSFKEPRAKAA